MWKNAAAVLRQPYNPKGLSHRACRFLLPIQEPIFYCFLYLSVNHSCMYIIVRFSATKLHKIVRFSAIKLHKNVRFSAIYLLCPSVFAMRKPAALWYYLISYSTAPDTIQWLKLVPSSLPCGMATRRVCLPGFKSLRSK